MNANILNLNEEEVLKENWSFFVENLTWMTCECINVWIMSYYFINGALNRRILEKKL